MGEIAKRGWERYIRQLHLHPLRTKVFPFPLLPLLLLLPSDGWDVILSLRRQAITAGVLSGVSDSVAQKLSGIQRLQLRRLLLKVVYFFCFFFLFFMLIWKE